MKARIVIPALAALLAVSFGQLANAACCGAASYSCCDAGAGGAMGASGDGGGSAHRWRRDRGWRDYGFSPMARQSVLVARNNDGHANRSRNDHGA